MAVSLIEALASPGVSGMLGGQNPGGMHPVGQARGADYSQLAKAIMDGLKAAQQKKQQQGAMQLPTQGAQPMPMPYAVPAQPMPMPPVTAPIAPPQPTQSSTDSDSYPIPMATAAGTTPTSARGVAESYLGRPLNDSEYTDLLRATYAESDGHPTESAMIAASILNRARDKGWSIQAVLNAPYQFESVTGNPANGHAPSQNYVAGPDPRSASTIEGAITGILPNVSPKQNDFTSGNPAAYKKGDNINVLYDDLAKGYSRVGGSIFNTAPPAGQPIQPIQPMGPGGPTTAPGIMSYGTAMPTSAPITGTLQAQPAFQPGAQSGSPLLSALTAPPTASPMLPVSYNQPGPQVQPNSFMGGGFRPGGFNPMSSGAPMGKSAMNL